MKLSYQKQIFRFSLLFVFLLLTHTYFSQNNNDSKRKKLVQFSGVVVDNDSLKPIPFTSILVKGTNHGTVSDFYGFFTLVASVGDTIEFFSVAYKDGLYKIPDTLQAVHYSIIQVLKKDTIDLPAVTIYPWPSRDEFKKAFLKLDVPSTDYDRAQKNLEESEMRELAKGISLDYIMLVSILQTIYLTLLLGQNLLNPGKKVN
jgi:hypothetical protein